MLAAYAVATIILVVTSLLTTYCMQRLNGRQGAVETAKAKHVFGVELLDLQPSAEPLVPVRDTNRLGARTTKMSDMKMINDDWVRESRICIQWN